MRSAYHIRALDVHRLLRVSRPLDVFLSHDWPQGIARHGDLGRLLQRKSFLRREVRGAHVCVVCGGKRGYWVRGGVLKKAVWWAGGWWLGGVEEGLGGSEGRYASLPAGL